LIPRWLLARLVSRTAEALLNLKDLLTVFPLSGQVTFSGFGGQLGRDSAYLLIPQGLLVRLLRRTDEGLLNLKGLLTMFPPRPTAYLKNEPILRPLFRAESYQIPPFSEKNMQIIAENAVFRHDFIGQRYSLQVAYSAATYRVESIHCIVTWN